MRIFQTKQEQAASKPRPKLNQKKKMIQVKHEPEKSKQKKMLEESISYWRRNGATVVQAKKKVRNMRSKTKVELNELEIKARKMLGSKWNGYFVLPPYPDQTEEAVKGIEEVNSILFHRKWTRFEIKRFSTSGTVFAGVWRRRFESNKATLLRKLMENGLVVSKTVDNRIKNEGDKRIWVEIIHSGNGIKYNFVKLGARDEHQSLNRTNILPSDCHHFRLHKVNEEINIESMWKSSATEISYRAAIQRPKLDSIWEIVHDSWGNATRRELIPAMTGATTVRTTFTLDGGFKRGMNDVRIGINAAIEKSSRARFFQVSSISPLTVTFPQEGLNEDTRIGTNANWVAMNLLADTSFREFADEYNLDWTSPIICI